MEVSLVRVNVFRKADFYSVSELLPGVLLLKNKQLKVINMAKRHIWANEFCFPSHLSQALSQPPHLPT